MDWKIVRYCTDPISRKEERVLNVHCQHSQYLSSLYCTMLQTNIQACLPSFLHFWHQTSLCKVHPSLYWCFSELFTPKIDGCLETICMWNHKFLLFNPKTQCSHLDFNADLCSFFRFDVCTIFRHEAKHQCVFFVYPRIVCILDSFVRHVAR
jgi:hypothetical protein